MHHAMTQALLSCCAQASCKSASATVNRASTHVSHAPPEFPLHLRRACCYVQVSLPGHICATVVTTLVLEGWSFHLDPRHSTLSEVRRMTAALQKGWRRWLAPATDDEVYASAMQGHQGVVALSA